MPTVLPQTPSFPLRGLLVGALALLVTACGGGGGSAATPAPPAATATLLSLSLSPAAPSLAPGGTRQMTATGAYSDGASKDLTATVSWTSSASSVATLSTGGMATAIAAGSATLTATASGIQGSTLLTVSAQPSSLVSLAITPASSSLVMGGTRHLLATGSYSDGTSRDLTTSVTWTSATPAVAAVNSAGQVVGIAVGSATIAATAGSLTTQAQVAVTAATLKAIDVTPANMSLTKGETKAYFATGTFSDGSTGPAAVSWSSSNPAVASVASTGVVTALGTGTTTITATSGNLTGSGTLAVTAATLRSLQVTPASSSFSTGATVALSATGTYTDGSTANLSASATWTSSTPAVATVSASGVATGVSAGSSTVTATSGAISGSATLTVTQPTAILTNISITPLSPVLVKGNTQQLTATGVMSSGPSVNLTSQVQWSSGNTAVAQVSALGLVSALNAGTAVIVARSADGAVSGQTTVTVTTPSLTSITLDPPSASLSIGGTVDITAIGNFSNGVSTNPYDTQVTWSSSNPAVATVESHGLVTAVGAGTTSIRATSGGVTASAAVTVAGASFDPALVGTWKFIDITGTYGSFYTFNSNGSFTYSLVYLNHGVCISTSQHTANRFGTFSSAPGKIILNVTTSYDDDYNCSGTGFRTTFQPSIQEHQAAFQSGQLLTNNPNDFYPTGWLAHTKQ
ncbi:MAG: hypothetical protein HGB30_00860 [Holophagaceae bacterium]|nr:hypothetical protein [Holophagaceae bacterium]